MTGFVTPFPKEKKHMDNGFQTVVWGIGGEFIGILNSVGPDQTASLGFHCLSGPMPTSVFEIIKHLLSPICPFTEW